ncbi:MAG: hypothetical protein LH478_07780 [Chitinophagaceae bacterium]|nr:hypothetical protein [Chitinophagaceae bacterium]
MHQSKSIKLKAALLLTVFALNTVVGFACSVGLDMGYNKKHHHDKQSLKTTTPHSHSHSNNNNSHHPESGSTLHNVEQSTSGKDDCCTNNAIKFQTEDKKLQQSQNITIKSPVFVAFLSAFLGLPLFSSEAFAGSNKYFIPQYYPPPDIRIVIQSFQI